MNHSNNYFQKGMLILVAAILLTIANMRAYSYFGNYQILSSAITANDDYKPKKYSSERKTLIFMANCTEFILIASVILGVLGVVAVATAKSSNNDITSYNENYTKNDFSKFDN